MNHDAAINRLTTALRPAVCAFLREHPELYVTGGFVRDVLIGATPKDIDVVVVGEQQFDPAQLQVSFAGQGTTIITTEKAHTVHWGPDEVNQVAPPLQVIRRVWPSLPAVFASFDWTVCRAALGWHPDAGWLFTVGPEFWQDLQDRRLRFCATPSTDKFGGAAGSMYRLERFLTRGQGWHIRANDLAAMARARLTELGAPNAGTLADSWLRAPGQANTTLGSSA